MLKEKRAFLFDIDGTLAVDETVYKGTKEILNYIDSIGGQAFYITNNSTKSRHDYVKKFAEWGIETSEEQFVTASYATALYLKENYPGQKIFAAGTESFIRELRDFGLSVTETAEDDIACVVVGFDQSLSYQKLYQTCQLLFRPGIDYIATNPDYRCPAEFGFIPDCGAICELLRVTTDRVPLFVGKPNPVMVELCLSQSGRSKQETLVVGDRLYTDIACGINAKVDTAVVYTGEAKEGDLAQTKYHPDYAFNSIYELYRTISGD